MTFKRDFEMGMKIVTLLIVLYFLNLLWYNEPDKLGVFGCINNRLRFEGDSACRQSICLQAGRGRESELKFVNARAEAYADTPNARWQKHKIDVIIGKNGDFLLLSKKTYD